MHPLIHKSRKAFEVLPGDRFYATTVPVLVARDTRRGDDGRISITFSDEDGHVGEEHTYAPYDNVFFPYPDRDPKDWRDSGEAPKAYELRIGDLLPSSTGDSSDEPQVVTFVQLNRQLWRSKAGHVRVYDVTTFVVSVSTPRRYRFTDEEPVAFPRPEITTDRPRSTGEVEWFGPYRNRETGALWEFTMHPTGRGRWPRGIDPYEPQRPPREDGLPHRARYPAYDWDQNLEPLEPGLPRGITRRGPRAPSIAFRQGLAELPDDTSTAPPPPSF